MAIIWRFILVSATMSLSTNVIAPTPQRTSDSAVKPPTPPTPNNNTFEFLKNDSLEGLKHETELMEQLLNEEFVKAATSKQIDNDYQGINDYNTLGYDMGRMSDETRS